MSVSPILKSSLYDAKNPVSIIQMTFDRFAGIERNPIQRNEVSRAGMSHLRVFSPTHLTVAIAVLPNGREYKIDGHTRVCAAKSGQASHLLKEKFFVTVYSVASEDDVIALYNQYDSRASVKTSANDVTGAFLMHGIEPKTQWVKAGKIASTLSLSYSAVASYYGLPAEASHFSKVAFFKKEIEMLDDFEPQLSRFRAGVASASLIAMKVFNDRAQSFFEDYNNGPGKSHANERDSVFMLHEFMQGERQRKTLQGMSNNQRHMQMTLALVMRHISKRVFYSSFPRPLNAREFLAK